MTTTRQPVIDITQLRDEELWNTIASVEQLYIKLVEHNRPENERQALIECARAYRSELWRRSENTILRRDA